MSDEWIYLDYAATTPVDPRVAEVITNHLTGDGEFANPSSLHAAGRAAAAAIELAAEALGGLLNCDPGGLVWTSGATESDNLAIQGVARARAHRGRHLITMPTEHKAVTDVFKALAKDGFDITWLDPGRDGRLDLDELAAAIRDDTTLVSIMHVNNETGMIQDVEGIAAVCKARDVIYHIDAAQALGKVELDLERVQADLVSMTAHKIYGPKGVGALYVRERPGARPDPLFFGGSQQGRLRPGTLPVHLIAGFGEAVRIARDSMQADRAHLAALHDRFWTGIEDLPGLVHNGSRQLGFPGILNVSAEGVDGESLLLALEPLCVSTGSACNSQNQEPSAVLRSMGLDDALAESAIRVSFGRPTTSADVDRAVRIYREAVLRLRELLPSAA